MKTFGKIAVLVMTLSLAFVLVACGGSSSSSSAASNASASASASASSASVSADSTSSESASASSAAEDGGVYVNEFFGIKFYLPEGWSFVDKSAIEEMNTVAAAASENAELDMVATNADKNQVLLVSVEGPNETNAGMTAEQYLEAQEELMKKNLEGNYTYTATSASLEFEGINRELPVIIMSLNVNGAEIFICQAVAEQEGCFFNAVSVGSNEDEAKSAFENFTAIVQ